MQYQTLLGHISNMSEKSESKDQAAQEKPSSGGGGSDLGSISLIQVMDSIEDHVSKLDDSIEAIENEELKASLARDFDRVKGLMLLFQQKSITEITQQDRALKEARKREANWKDLSDLFAEYRKKAQEEMDSLKQMLESYRDVKTELQSKNEVLRTENAALQEENVVLRDAMLRAKAIAARRLNLARLQAQLDADERDLWESGPSSDK